MNLILDYFKIGFGITFLLIGVCVFYWRLNDPNPHFAFSIGIIATGVISLSFGFLSLINRKIASK